MNIWLSPSSIIFFLCSSLLVPLRNFQVPQRPVWPGVDPFGCFLPGLELLKRSQYKLLMRKTFSFNGRPKTEEVIKEVEAWNHVSGAQSLKRSKRVFWWLSNPLVEKLYGNKRNMEGSQTLSVKFFILYKFSFSSHLIMAMHWFFPIGIRKCRIWFLC